MLLKLSILIVIAVPMFAQFGGRPFDRSASAKYRHAANGALLPDPVVTPGVVDPSITQANIKTTICVPNYTKSVRPPASYTDKLKVEQMKAYGLKGKPDEYEEDHRLDLAAAGAAKDPHNLWPEIWTEARMKDRLETYTHRQLCAGKMTLKQVQSIFLGDWWMEYDRIAPKEGWPKVH